MDEVKAHRYSNNNREILDKSARCGCFYCLNIYSPHKIIAWTDNGETAICPYCGIDSIIGDASGVLLSMEFLTTMYKTWFGG